jgi:hypothetical protein
MQPQSKEAKRQVKDARKKIKARAPSDEPTIPILIASYDLVKRSNSQLARISSTG